MKRYYLLLGTLSLSVASASVWSAPSIAMSVPVCLRRSQVSSPAEVEALSLPYDSTTAPTVLTESWIAYRDRFIQEDGRVVDWERADQHSTSEGQAYAMLRAVLIDDPNTFIRTLNWAETHLARTDEDGKLIDRLWGWRWGEGEDGTLQVLDANFASDADIDAITALILAARRWNCPEYLRLARLKLDDLWNLSVVELANGDRHLLPGPRDAFWPEPDLLILNPSYFSPYAYRLFADVELDSERDWLSLIDSGYRALYASSNTSRVGLPSDWIALNPQTGAFSPIPEGRSLTSQYGFDAFRVWWRLSLDAAWYDDLRAKLYLATRSMYLQGLWRAQETIPAQIDLQGRSLVDYESTAQYAMLYPALRLINPDMADQLYQQKLMPTYRHGFWDNDSAYYTQNLAWFGLLPEMPPALISRD
ncbi:MAG: glycosyl hydrolase family 8 [Elainellaceae cyanobacterium]